MDGIRLPWYSRSPHGRLESDAGRLRDPVQCPDGAGWSGAVGPRGELLGRDRRWLVERWYEYDLVLLGLALVGMRTGEFSGRLLTKRCRVKLFVRESALGGGILAPSFVWEMVIVVGT